MTPRTTLGILSLTGTVLAGAASLHAQTQQAPPPPPPPQGQAGTAAGGATQPPVQPTPPVQPPSTFQTPLQPSTPPEATDAFLQQRLERPYRGVFGGTAIGPDSPGLSATFSGYGGHDDDLLAAQTGTAQPGTLLSGNFVGGNLGMVYRKLSPNLGQGFNLTAEFDSDYRRYSAFEQMITDYAGGVAADFPVGRKMRVAVHQTAEYGSVFRVGLLPASAVGGDTFSDYALGDRKRTSYYTSGQATYTLTRTSAIVANGLFRDTDSDGYDLDRRIRGGGISYQHLINRNFNLVLGYLYQQSDYGNPLLGQRTTINTFDLGGNYLWPLGASRRTTLTFGGGTGKVSQEVSAGSTGDFYRFFGNATLLHQMGRTWTLSAVYDRGLQFSDLLPEPFFVDSLRTGLDGLISPRLEFHAAATYSNGQMQVTVTRPTYKTYAATAGLAFALSRAWQLDASYGYYYYDLGSQAALPPIAAPQVDRQSIRVGLSYWLPLWGNEVRR